MPRPRLALDRITLCNGYLFDFGNKAMRTKWRIKFDHFMGNAITWLCISAIAGGMLYFGYEFVKKVSVEELVQFSLITIASVAALIYSVKKLNHN